MYSHHLTFLSKKNGYGRFLKMALNNFMVPAFVFQLTFIGDAPFVFKSLGNIIDQYRLKQKVCMQSRYQKVVTVFC